VAVLTTDEDAFRTGDEEKPIESAFTAEKTPAGD
jgi:hypothetical protein